MKNVTKRILTVLIILLVIGLAFLPKIKPLFLPKPNEAGKGDKMAAGLKSADAKGPGAGAAKGLGAPSPVEVMVVSSESLDEKIQTTGTIIANEEVDIRSEVSGRITAINFREGDQVAKGTVLLKIYDTDLRAQLLKLEANRKLAETNEARQKRLFEKEAISRQEYDIVQTNLSGVLADIENLRAQLSKTLIRAPFDGTVGLRHVSVGAYLSPASPIATLTNVNPAKIDFAIPAKYARAVHRGSKIQFSVEGSSARRTGTVYAVEPKVDPDTRSLLLRAVSPNEDRALVPGAFARIDVVLSSRGNAIVVPTQAIVPEQKGQKVFIVKNHKAESVPVQIGLRTDRTVEIKSGLHTGDSLITSGIQGVKQGGDVSVQ
jgi:membrane fusion protein, multidrug efflux system